MFSSFETLISSNNITKWKSSGVYDKDDSSLEAVNGNKGEAPRLTVASQNGKINVRFYNCMLKQNKIIDNYGGSAINVYITFRLRANKNPPDFCMGNCLFGAVKIQKAATNSSHYKYSGYGVCYDFDGDFSFGNNLKARSLIIFGVASSTYSTNKANNFYMLGNILTQSIKGTTTYADKRYKTDLSIPEKMYVMSMHYNGDDSYLFINGTQELKFKAADNLGKNKFCVVNISDEFSIINMEKTSLFGNV